MNNPKYSEEFKATIAKKYIEDGLSLNQIKNQYNVSTTFICDSLKKLGHKTRGISHGMKKFLIDENYFSKIDTPEKAQILGMFYADGCLSNASKYSQSLSITLHSDDIDYLEFIKKQTKHEGSIKTIKCQLANTIHIHNRKIIEDIRKLGIHERKSLDLDFPTEDMVPPEFQNAFLLGYYEGDGSFYYNPNNGRQPPTLAVCGTKEFLTKVAKLIKEKFNVNSYLYQKPKHKTLNINTFILKIGGSQQSRKVMDWLYSSPTSFFMKRKFDKYASYRKRYDESGQLKPEFKGIYKR